MAQSDSPSVSPSASKSPSASASPSSSTSPDLTGVKVFKIALPGYNATTDTNPDHFSLYVDQHTDYVLIKEKTRSSISVAGSGGSQTIAHGLGYVPFVLVFYTSASGTYRKVHGATDPALSNPYFEVDTTNLVLKNPTANTVTMSYYIFYDNIT